MLDFTPYVRVLVIEERLDLVREFTCQRSQLAESLYRAATHLGRLVAKRANQLRERDLRVGPHLRKGALQDVR